MSFGVGTFSGCSLALPEEGFGSPGSQLTHGHGERGQTDHSSLIGTIRNSLPSKRAGSSSHFKLGLPVKTGGRVGIVLDCQMKNIVMGDFKV
jgi:hypothetical protein